MFFLLFFFLQFTDVPAEKNLELLYLGNMF
uniref:Uncharacterized protein n=1 Tax=Arundo donax TaxID=35708 RepID=A0A0A9AD79_ARUDO